MILPDLLLRLTVCRPDTPYHPPKQSESMVIAVSYPVDPLFTTLERVLGNIIPTVAPVSDPYGYLNLTVDGMGCLEDIPHPKYTEYSK